MLKEKTGIRGEKIKEIQILDNFVLLELPFIDAEKLPVAIIDCFGILDDDQIKQYFELGCEVKGLGRGHIQRIKEDVR
ncbi:MAG: hypothetical protein H8D42_05955 [Candidatus Marinimicrobia bacterium]|nr:hypothetical protein [Candidatus Neomarinimicrobiota bacterium]